jgi:hypothetical protein
VLLWAELLLLSVVVCAQALNAVYSYLIVSLVSALLLYTVFSPYDTSLPWPLSPPTTHGTHTSYVSSVCVPWMVCKPLPPDAQGSLGPRTSPPLRRLPLPLPLPACCPHAVCACTQVPVGVSVLGR